jgi:hypothetical protein
MTGTASGTTARALWWIMGLVGTLVTGAFFAIYGNLRSDVTDLKVDVRTNYLTRREYDYLDGAFAELRSTQILRNERIAVLENTMTAQAARCSADLDILRRDINDLKTFIFENYPHYPPKTPPFAAP